MDSGKVQIPEVSSKWVAANNYSNLFSTPKNNPGVKNQNEANEIPLGLYAQQDNEEEKESFN